MAKDSGAGKIWRKWVGSMGGASDLESFFNRQWQRQTARDPAEDDRRADSGRGFSPDIRLWRTNSYSLLR